MDKMTRGDKAMVAVESYRNGNIGAAKTYLKNRATKLEILEFIVALDAHMVGERTFERALRITRDLLIY